MPSQIPQFFPNIPAAAVNYNWEDLASGLGYTYFYLIQSYAGGAGGWHLITTTERSADIEETTAGANQEFEFETSAFNVPRTVKGSAWFSCSTKCSAAGNSNSFTVQLHKVSGVTETNISAAITRTIGLSAAITYHFIEIPCTETTLGVGDYLRLSVTLAPGAGQTLYIGTDPADRAGTALGAGETMSRIAVPFEVDI